MAAYRRVDDLVTCGQTACTPGSAPGPTLGNEYGKHVLFHSQYLVYSGLCCYQHMPIGKVWIYRLLFVCVFVCVFVRLRISPPSTKLAASNFSRWFIGVQQQMFPLAQQSSQRKRHLERFRQSHIFVNFAPQKHKIGQIGESAGHATRM